MSVQIQVETAAKLNFACHQSAFFTLIQDLRVQNDGAERMENMVLSLSADPPFLEPKRWPLDRLEPESLVAVGKRDVDLDGDFLLQLVDSVRGTVIIRLERGTEVLGEVRKPVELLARNEWGGTEYMPELLAAFSMPNDPAIDRILHTASLLLRQAGKPDALKGYECGSRERVWEMVSAIYTAIANLNITYALPPASFERNGQKIREPGRMLDARVGTCLDTTMLFASALEQAQLNPVVVLPEGHALIGCWLQPEEFTSIVTDEAETLRKRVQLKDMILVETTLATANPAPLFSKAVEQGYRCIVQEKDDSFWAGVDIRQARASRILPLGLRHGQGPGEAAVDEGAAEALVLEEAPALPGFDQELETPPESPEGRLERWQRRLLDLSARNPLLNHKSTRASLRIFCPEPGKLEDQLAAGRPISIVPAAVRRRDEDVHEQRTGERISEASARTALGEQKLLVDLSKEELSTRLVNIYRRMRTALQEGGANTLYLALGFLRWRRSRDQKPFHAPLIMIPVTLERKSVHGGIRMLAHDDESRFNTTLLEMLRKDFEIDIPGLDGELPKDDSGVDVDRIWRIVRQAILEEDGFEVSEEVVLGHFSFAKYLMWKDLVDRTEVLRQNPIVRHLLDTPQEAYANDGIEPVRRERLDRDYQPADLLVPLPADASQMAAIATADLGKSFIIIGPPGTGKSQTISNLIAHMLGKGKTVLFVSEKTAALEVVYRRLRDIGLSRFCLELHSNKASRVDVIQQIGQELESADGQAEHQWQEKAEQLRRLRDKLNRFVDRMHKRHRNGLTPYEAIGRKVQDEALAEQVKFSWPRADQHDAEQRRAMREAVSHVQTHVQSIGNIADSPFRMVTHGEWSPRWEEQVTEKARQLAAAATRLDQTCGSLLDAVGISLPDRTERRLRAISALADFLTDAHRKQTAYALEPNGEDTLDALGQAVVQLQVYAGLQQDLSCAYEPMAWKKLDADAIARRWQAANATWWPRSFFAKRAIIKYMCATGAQGNPDPEQDAAVLGRLRQSGELIEHLGGQLSGLDGWEGYTTDPATLQAVQKLGQRTRDVVLKLVEKAPQDRARVWHNVQTLLRDRNDLLAAAADVGQVARTFRAAFSEFDGAFKEFQALVGRFNQEFLDADRMLDVIRESAETIADRHAELKDWCTWRKRRDEALDLELRPLVDAIEQGRVATDNIEKTFEAAYCAWWSSAILNEDEVLRTFNTAEHEALIKDFRKVDKKFQEITADYIVARLRNRQEAASEVPQYQGQWGLFRREMQKKKGHKSIRQLVQETPEVLTAVAPCMMMSPLSAAWYLPAEQQLFDIVIFDEASQITTWDAVGVLARGKQVIVAGDPKQMPPTNFFMRAEDDDPDGDVDVEGDMESILDEMQSAGISKHTLRLHYRSRRESLIAFSNSRYYDGELVTFPAPEAPGKGVRLVRPKGFYERGGACHNEGEARAITAEIVRRVTHADEAVRNQSIGVVTFNTSQQTLIEDLLDEARNRNPNLEWAFSNDAPNAEPVFVKNLETVQGDERDVILFSVTYGPDQSGHITMNFGPLNRQGGERRLNVALTRARYEMVVYSTLHPDQINLARTQARAVRDLKHFLEYAERGQAALGAAVHGPKGDFESPFESAVAKSLRDKGWDVLPQIGVSAYRIDLGIVHPDVTGRFLAGVECDGAMYHSSAFARERDRIRQEVLEGLGWTLERVWSTDWWTNRAGALEKLHTALEQHLAADLNRARTTEADESADESATERTVTDAAALPQ